MNKAHCSPEDPGSLESPSRVPERSILRCSAFCAMAAFFLSGAAFAQVITIDKQGNATSGDHAATVDRRFAQIEPTHVDLPKSDLDAKTRQEIIRIMQSEQGFAMRPFPKGHKGLTLVANGKLEPAGEPYLSMITSQGTSAKPGDRVVLTDVKIENSKIIFDLNGGPDKKHRFLRHVQLGSGPMMNPVVQGDDQDPQGARLTLDFKSHIPSLTGSQVKALLAPLISFDVKTPIQAFTDTLPPKLKEAILTHHVLVGMSTEMVLYALGQPQTKTREMEGQMPFEEWIYGKPPKDIEFVRINGNRVIRLEVAKMGETPQIFDKDEVEGMMRTDGTPLAPTNTRTVAMGDTQRDPNTQAPNTPPTLRKEGETIPQDANPTSGVMRPVRFPTQKPTDQSDQADPVEGSPADPAAKAGKPKPGAPDSTQPSPATPASPPSQSSPDGDPN